MPRQANGSYQQPANTSAVSGQSISSTAFNTLVSDLGTEITNSLDRSGRSGMAAALPMGGNKITGMADPTASTDATTKNYVDSSVAAFFSTGDVKLTLKTAADPGWVLVVTAGDGSGSDSGIGSAASGAGLRANADCQALFTLVFNSMSDTNAPLYTSGGSPTTRAAQTNAATAWAANCRIFIGFFAGRALGVAGTGSGLTRRNPGAFVGEETHLLTTAEMPSHTHANSLSDPGHTHPLANSTNVLNAAQAGNVAAGGGGTGTRDITVASAATGITITNASAGSGGAHNNMQPTTFLNMMVKL